jgi:hypothetical protein
MGTSIDSLIIDLVIQIVIWTIFVVPALWISGRLLAGKENAKFTDALWIVVLGTVIYYFTSFFIETFFVEVFGSFLLSYLVLLLIWLALVKHFFDCGWLKALAISIITVIIAFLILLILVFVVALLGYNFDWLTNSTPILNNI